MTTDQTFPALSAALKALEILNDRPRPLCRDCADCDGTCPNDGLPCDMGRMMNEAAIELAAVNAPIATRDATIAELRAERAALSDALSFSQLAHAAAREAVADLRTQLAAMTADAARYRWLRDVGDATWRPFGIRAGYSAAQADAAIDAARAVERRSA